MDTKPLCESMEEMDQSDGEDGDVEEGISRMSFQDNEQGPPPTSFHGVGGMTASLSGSGVDRIGNNSVTNTYTVPQNRHQATIKGYSSTGTVGSEKFIGSCRRSSFSGGNSMERQSSSQNGHHHHNTIVSTDQYTSEHHKNQQSQRRPYGSSSSYSGGGGGSQIQNGNGPRKSLNPMVVVGLNDDDHYSSSSPFHSATEDFMDNEHDRDRDRDPLIKPPAKTGGFHQLLNSKLKKQSSSSSSFNNDKDSHNSRSRGDHDKDEGGEGKRGCSVGIFLAAVSCIFFATSALIVKISDLHPMELLGVRGLIQGILVSPLVISTGSSLIPEGSKSLLFSRAILGSMALIMSFSAIHLIPLADAATVIFTSPVFVSIFACLCLGEVCGWFDVAMITLTLLGVLLVSKPSFGFISSGSWTSIGGTFCGLAAAMLTALAFIVLRQLKHIHYSVTVFWFSSVLCVFGAILTIALDGFVLPSDFTTISECIIIGVCGFFGQILLTKALQIESAGPVSIVRTLDIVLAFFFQVTFLHDIPDWKSYLGSVLVVSCVILTAFRRWHRERGSSSPSSSSSGLAKSLSPSSSTSQLNPNRS